MLEKILKLYVMAMANDVRSPLPHLFGPPGCGKSTVIEQAAQLLDVNLHTINVSRISPLELEGVQMPHTDEELDLRLKLLTATYWTQLKEGDILLMDEFLRGFPEVYNGLLDIFTSRTVGGYKLPKVFIIGASNSTVSYDKALEDRLLHLPVPDPRTDKKEKDRLAKLLVEALGLLPQMAKSVEMNTLLDTEVLPMYEMLDALKNKRNHGGSIKGNSLRNLIGQAQLREVSSPALAELISMNNVAAMRDGKPQFVLLLDGKSTSMPANYPAHMQKLKGNPRLTPKQKLNLDLNYQLVEMELARTETDDDERETQHDDIDEFFS